MQALAESREWQLLEKHLATPKGSKVLQVCHMVLRHTQSVLSLMPPSGVQQGPTATTPAGAAGSGTASSVMSSMARNTECEARQLLAHMCEERLMPTYWLNEVSVQMRWFSLLIATALLARWHFIGMFFWQSTVAGMLAGYFFWQVIPCSICCACITSPHRPHRSAQGLLLDILVPLLLRHAVQGITDPLYVKHQPQHFLIQEDAEAARYPGLFSHRLLQNRRDWQQHAQQIQAPRSKLLQLQHSARA
jgi:hypothetical protein